MTHTQASGKALKDSDFPAAMAELVTALKVKGVLPAAKVGPWMIVGSEAFMSGGDLTNGRCDG